MSRVAVVTGGTRGLGAAISIALSRAGYQVAAVYRGNVESATAFNASTSIPVFKWDIADFDACKVGLIDVQAKLGPVDILINNGGITRDVTLHRMSPQQWNEVIATNLTSHYNMCRNVIEGMRERGFGRIVNMSSINGQKGQVGQSNYAASKAGILGFTRALALENASRGITVNAIAPGYCDTDMVARVRPEVLKSVVASIPAGRLGKPDDVARLVAFLVRDENDFINGATFDINGGQLMI